MLPPPERTSERSAVRTKRAVSNQSEIICDQPGREVGNCEIDRFRSSEKTVDHLASPPNPARTPDLAEFIGQEFIKPRSNAVDLWVEELELEASKDLFD